ncbi:MAG: peptidase T, partial [Acetatifactor sp.]|nr:peptidase T [Acetatifactor sp.]
MENVIDRFLRYVQIDTCSDEESTTHPSTMKQHDLARLLVQELETMGAAEITYDREHCYVYATVPASQGCEDRPVVGFIAHMDTSPAMSGTGVKPRIVKDYDGEDIV